MSEVDSAVANVDLIGGNCDAVAALSRCKTSLFVGASEEIKRVLVVLMAGKSPGDVSTAAESLKTVAGVQIITVGMGGSFDQSQLSDIAYNPSHFLSTASFDGLAGINRSLCTLISQGICKTISSFVFINLAFYSCGDVVHRPYCETGLIIPANVQISFSSCSLKT